MTAQNTFCLTEVTQWRRHSTFKLIRGAALTRIFLNLKLNK